MSSLHNDLGRRNASYQLALPDWQEVSPGHEVSLYKKGQGHFHGRVDDVTPDGSIMWVHLANGWGRRMFVRAEGYHLTIHWIGASIPDNHTGQRTTVTPRATRK